jgi:imidazolonepropionase-like amidohydrolase
VTCTYNNATAPPPSFRSYWSLMKLSPETVAGLKRRYKQATGLVRAMHQAGVPFLAGTDTPGVPYVFPGFSLHDELALLVAEGGFTPLEVLQAAPAKQRDSWAERRILAP